MSVAWPYLQAVEVGFFYGHAGTYHVRSIARWQICIPSMCRNVDVQCRELSYDRAMLNFSGRTKGTPHMSCSSTYCHPSKWMFVVLFVLALIVVLAVFPKISHAQGVSVPTCRQWTVDYFLRTGVSYCTDQNAVNGWYLDRLTGYYYSPQKGLYFNPKSNLYWDKRGTYYTYNLHTRQFHQYTPRAISSPQTSGSGQMVCNRQLLALYKEQMDRYAAEGSLAAHAFATNMYYEMYYACR